MTQRYPDTYISEPVKGTIYILELARKGCRKIVASSMPEAPTDVDHLIPFGKVPLHIRRAARLHLLGDAT